MGPDWRQVRIGELGRVVTGRTPPGNDGRYYGDAVPFLTPSDMDDHRSVERPARHLSAFGAAELNRCLVPQGVGVSCIGWQMGKAVLIERPTITNQQINSIIVDTAVADRRFVYYSLSLRRSEFFKLGAGGSRTPILNKGDFERLPFVLPPVVEQRAIARILGALDDKIELNRRMNATLEAMARALFKSWFVEFDPVRAKSEGRAPTGMDADTAKLFPSEFVDSELGLIPKGWSLGNISDLASNRRDTIHPRDVSPGSVYIGLEHLPRGRVFLEDTGTPEDLESLKAKFAEGEVLFGKLRPYFKKVAVAPCDGICSTDILVLSPDEKTTAFVTLLAASDPFIEHCVALSDGTRMPRTSWEQLTRFKVVLPPTGVLHLFEDLCFAPFRRAAVLRSESEMLARIRDELLPRLLSGELSVADGEPIGRPS
jgi:type I restriction enzyme, S subunit